MLAAGLLAVTGSDDGGTWLSRAEIDIPPAMLRIDFIRAHFWHNGASYADETTMLAAIGGTRVGNARNIGPNAAAGAIDLIVNGTFDTDLSGWTSVLLGSSSVAVVSQAAQLSSDGTSVAGQGAAGLEQAVNTIADQPYFIDFTNTAGTVAVNIGTSAKAYDLYSNVAVSPGTHRFPFTAIGTQTHAYLYRIPAGSPSVDTVSVMCAIPYAGFGQGAGAVVIAAVAPATFATGQVIWRLDASDRDRIALTIDATTGIVRLNMRRQNIDQVQMVVGTLTAGQRFTIAASWTGDDFRAVLNGGAIARDTAAVVPGVAIMRLGTDAAGGSLFTGSFETVAAYNSPLDDFTMITMTIPEDAIAGWGDSLTAGAGATGGSTGANTYPAVAGALLGPDRLVSNLGRGGQTSTQIAARMNAQPILVSISGGQIPSSGGVAVTAKNINVLSDSGLFTGTKSGTLAGIDGNMSTDGSGNWTFTRAGSGAIAACPANTRFVTTVGRALQGKTAWLWLGRNGAQAGYTVAADIAAVVESLGHRRFLVGALLTGSGDSPTAISDIVAENAALAATYSMRFVDLLGALQGAHDGSANDLADIAAGYTPRSLRSDTEHLNDAGYALVAAQFKSAHDAMGW